MQVLITWTSENQTPLDKLGFGDINGILIKDYFSKKDIP